jgi:hypothetical protein
MRLSTYALLLAACYSPHVSTGAPCGTGEPCPLPLTCSPASSTCELVAVDAAIGDTLPADGGDAGPIADASLCFGSGLVSVCLDSAPTGSLQLADMVIDTDNSTNCTQLVFGNPTLCVVAADVMSVMGTVSASGKHPLVLIATEGILIEGTVDVASHTGGQTGAGNDPPLCGVATAPVAPGGGAGGSFGNHGGNGGAGLPSGTGGISAAPATTITALRGGCHGGGGGLTGAATGGTAGHGGGAVYLISRSIDVMGTIDASGAGGTGCTGSCGGGGGGAGGMIGFDTQMLTIGPAAKVFANGGGGGEGAATSTGANGADPGTPNAAAVGGTGGTLNGGDGGAGAFGSNPGANAGSGGGTTGGGGGGGGGAGVIQLYGAHPSLGTNVSPPPST